MKRQRFPLFSNHCHIIFCTIFRGASRHSLIVTHSFMFPYIACIVLYISPYFRAALWLDDSVNIVTLPSSQISHVARPQLAKWLDRDQSYISLVYNLYVCCTVDYCCNVQSFPPALGLSLTDWTLTIISLCDQYTRLYFVNIQLSILYVHHDYTVYVHIICFLHYLDC